MRIILYYQLFVGVLLLLIGLTQKPSNQDSIDAAEARTVLHNAQINGFSHPTYLQTIDSSIRLDPTSAEPFLAKAQYFSSQRSYDLAFNQLDAALKRDAQNTITYRGWIYLMHLHDYDKAILDFKEAIMIYEDNQVDNYYSYLQISRCYLQKRDFQQAYANLLLYIEKEDALALDPYTFTLKAFLEYLNGNYSEALESIEYSITQWPKSPEAFYIKSLTLHQLDEINLSCKAIQKAKIQEVHYLKPDYYNDFLNMINEEAMNIHFDIVCK